MSTKVVPKLPILDQALFPPLPSLIDDGTLVRPFGSRLGNNESELVLGILLTAAVRHGEWVPVKAAEFGQLVERHVPMFQHGGVQEALRRLVDANAADYVRVGPSTRTDNDYIVLSPAFAAHLKDCEVRRVPLAA